MLVFVKSSEGSSDKMYLASQLEYCYLWVAAVLREGDCAITHFYLRQISDLFRIVYFL